MRQNGLPKTFLPSLPQTHTHLYRPHCKSCREALQYIYRHSILDGLLCIVLCFACSITNRILSTSYCGHYEGSSMRKYPCKLEPEVGELLLTNLSKGFKRAKGEECRSEIIRNCGAQDLSCPPWLGCPEQSYHSASSFRCDQWALASHPWFSWDVQCVQFIGGLISSSNSTTRVIFFWNKETISRVSSATTWKAPAFQHKAAQCAKCPGGMLQKNRRIPCLKLKHSMKLLEARGSVKFGLLWDDQLLLKLDIPRWCKTKSHHKLLSNWCPMFANNRTWLS